MGNSPSQTGFQVPGSEVGRVSGSGAGATAIGIGRGQPHPQHLSNLSQSVSASNNSNMSKNHPNSSSTNLNPSCPESGLSVPNSVFRFTGSGNASGSGRGKSTKADADANEEPHPASLSKPIQFVEEPVFRNLSWDHTDQSQSMDSLALDTSCSIHTGDMSPSSLSPDIPGFKFQYQNPSLGVIHKAHEIKDDQDVLSHFDSLDESSVDLNDEDDDKITSLNNQSTTSSSTIVEDVPIVTSKPTSTTNTTSKQNPSVVTVNGFQVAPDQLNDHNSSIKQDEIKDSTIYFSQLHKKRSEGSMSPPSSGFVSEPENSMQNNQSYQNNEAQPQPREFQSQSQTSANRGINEKIISKLPMHDANMHPSNFCSALNTSINKLQLEKDKNTQACTSSNSHLPLHLVNNVEKCTNGNLKELGDEVAEGIENAENVENLMINSTLETTSENCEAMSKNKNMPDKEKDVHDANAKNKFKEESQNSKRNVCGVSPPEEACKDKDVSKTEGRPSNTSTKYGQNEEKCFEEGTTLTSKVAKNNFTHLEELNLLNVNVSRSGEHAQDDLLNANTTSRTRENETIVVTNLTKVDGMNSENSEDSETYTTISLRPKPKDVGIGVDDSIDSNLGKNRTQMDLNDRNNTNTLGNRSKEVSKGNNKNKNPMSNFHQDLAEHIKVFTQNKSLSHIPLGENENESICSSNSKIQIEDNDNDNSENENRKKLIVSESLDEFEVLENQAELPSPQMDLTRFEFATKFCANEKISEHKFAPVFDTEMRMPIKNLNMNSNCIHVDNPSTNSNGLSLASMEKSVSFVDEIFVRNPDMDVYGDHDHDMANYASSLNSLHSSQDCEIQEESINFHKEATRLIQEIMAARAPPEKMTSTLVMNKEVNPPSTNNPVCGSGSENPNPVKLNGPNFHGLTSDYGNGTGTVLSLAVEDSSKDNNKSNSNSNRGLGKWEHEDKGICKPDSTRIELKGQHISKVYVSNEDANGGSLKVKLPLIEERIEDKLKSLPVTVNAVNEQRGKIKSQPQPQSSLEINPSALLQEDNFFIDFNGNGETPTKAKLPKLSSSRNKPPTTFNGNGHGHGNQTNTTTRTEATQKFPGLAKKQGEMAAHSHDMSVDMFEEYDGTSSGSRTFTKPGTTPGNSFDKTINLDRSAKRTSANNTLDNLAAMVENLEISSAHKKPKARCILSKLDENSKKSNEGHDKSNINIRNENDEEIKQLNIPFQLDNNSFKRPSNGVGAPTSEKSPVDPTRSHQRKSEILNRNSVSQHQEKLSKDLQILQNNSMPPSLADKCTEMNGTNNHDEHQHEETLPNEEHNNEIEHDANFSKQLQEKENYINELQNNLQSMKLKAESEPDYTKVLAEYEKTLSTYIQKVEDMKSKLQQTDEEKLPLIRERDQALEDLHNVESAFNDVHRKYERSKTVLQNLKSNEDTLIRRDQELIQKIELRDKKIEAIKDKANESIEQMHLDYENRIRDLESENTRLRAQFRKMEMKLESLENDVEQKAKVNAQLSALCDELINGQGVSVN